MTRLPRPTLRRPLRPQWPFTLLLLPLLLLAPASAQVAVQGELIHTMAGSPLRDGVVLLKDGKIEAIGPAATLAIPGSYRVLKAKVVTPGLVDAHTVVGMSGLLNQPEDQEQLEKSTPIQPELRAVDGYNPRDPLVDWVRSFGVTTLHTGHAPGALISGQTMIVKTHPPNLEQALVAPSAMVACTLGTGAVSDKKDKPPGSSAKAVALLRAEFIKAREYGAKLAKPDPEKRPPRDLRLETLGRVLDGAVPLLVTVQRHQDILAALRVAAEFKLRIVLDGVADAPLVLDDIRQSGFPVILHPTMARASREAENLSFETAGKLRQAGVTLALQSGYESYVPKTRVVLLEAGVAAANGLSTDDALAAITIQAARVLGVDSRLGSLEPGKDADLALYDGDPFEYTTHCLGTIVNGIVLEPPARD